MTGRKNIKTSYEIRAPESPPPDINCILGMAKNLFQFCNDRGFTESFTHKEIQPINMNSFIKYFNVNISYIIMHLSVITL
jgi:hypothetical protein